MELRLISIFRSEKILTLFSFLSSFFALKTVFSAHLVTLYRSVICEGVWQEVLSWTSKGRYLDLKRASIESQKVVNLHLKDSLLFLML